MEGLYLDERIGPLLELRKPAYKSSFNRAFCLVYRGKTHKKALIGRVEKNLESSRGKIKGKE